MTTGSLCSSLVTVHPQIGHILFIEGVGKTSIILTLVTETFPRQPPKKYNPVIVQPDMLPSSKQTMLMDSSSKDSQIVIRNLDAREDEQSTDHEIEKASVIILVYDVNNIECIKRNRSYWIPRIEKINNKVSILTSYNYFRSRLFWSATRVISAHRIMRKTLSHK